MEAQVKQLQEELEGLGLSSLPGLRSLGDINDIPLPKLHSLQSQLRLDLEAVDGVSPAGQLLSLQGRAKRTGLLAWTLVGAFCMCPVDYSQGPSITCTLSPTYSFLGSGHSQPWDPT